MTYDDGAGLGALLGAGVADEEFVEPDPFGVMAPPPAVSDPDAAAVLGAALAEPVGPGRWVWLERVEVRLLAAGDRIDYLVAWRGCAAWAAARSDLAVAAVAGRRGPVDCSEPSSKPTGDVAEDERVAAVGAAAHLAKGTTANLLADARCAAGVLAPVTAVMLAGGYSSHHAWYARSAVTGHRASLAAAAVTAVCARPAAPTWTPKQLGDRIRAELDRLDSKAAADRIRARRRERGARLEPLDDLRARMSVEGPWDTISWAFRQFRRWAEVERDRLRAIRRTDPGARFCCAEAMARLLAHATPDQTAAQDGDAGPAGAPPAAVVVAAGDACPFCGAADTGVPTLSELTADAVVSAAGLLASRLGDQGADLSPARGKKWRYAAIVMDAPTAAGLAENPGHVPGYGPVPAPIARELLADAEVWRRFLVDTSGVLEDAGACTYRPSDRLRDHVTARDLTCTFPGCTAPAVEAELDHIDNFDGTNTRAVNLHALCPAHHRVKTHTGWTPTRLPDGTTRWTSPTGHTYLNTPDPPWHTYPPDGSGGNATTGAGAATDQVRDTHPRGGGATATGAGAAGGAAWEVYRPDSAGTRGRAASATATTGPAAAPARRRPRTPAQWTAFSATTTTAENRLHRLLTNHHTQPTRAP